MSEYKAFELATWLLKEAFEVDQWTVINSAKAIVGSADVSSQIVQSAKLDKGL